MLRALALIAVLLAPSACGSEPSVRDGLDETAIGRTAVSTGKLTLRAHPQPGAKKVVALPEGSVVAVTALGDEVESDGVVSRWCRAELPDGAFGWCPGGGLELGHGAWGEVDAAIRWSSSDGAVCAVGPSGRYIAATGFPYRSDADPRLTVFDATSGDALSSYDSSARSIPRHVSSAMLEDTFLFASYDYEGDDRLVSLEMPSGEYMVYGRIFDGEGRLGVLAANADGSLVAAGLGGVNVPPLAVFNVRTEEWIPAIEDRACVVVSAAFSPDSSLLAFSSEDAPFTAVRDVVKGEIIWTKPGLSGRLAFSGDGSTVYCVSTLITVIDARSGAVRRVFPLDSLGGRAATAVALSEEAGIMAVVNGSPYITFVDPGIGRTIAVVKGDLERIESCSLSRDGGTLAVSQAKEDGRLQGMRVLDLNVRHDGLFGPSKARAPVADSPAEADVIGFIVSNVFSDREGSPFAYISFDEGGRYRITARHRETVEGFYAVEGKTVRLHRLPLTGDALRSAEASYGPLLKQLSLGTGGRGSVLTPDPEYADFHSSGALRHEASGTIYATGVESPAGEVYSFMGADCRKHPVDGPSRRYISPDSNLRMRSTPSLSGELVVMPYNYYARSSDTYYYAAQRSVIYQDTVHLVRAVTVKEDTVDGITAPWYLILEWDGDDAEGGWWEWAWVFGGYVKEFGPEELDRYREREQATLSNTLYDLGLEQE